MYKIVDTINGYESQRKFRTLRTAQAELDKMYHRFRNSLGNNNAYFCKTIAPADATYDWNYRCNQFEWSELSYVPTNEEENA